ncbi:hypothetical protein ABIA39_004872 [Nocardia sp. GAS34]|uniref:hypothetical protein n=1 Tax=unclassified Nocardia TaxID=2637762 RepID=UPI003D213051
MRVFEHGDRSVWRTDLGNMCATWEIGGDQVPRVLFVSDFTSSTPAYRWPDIPMPSCRTGHVAFGPEYPTLAEATELLPQYETTLWEHLRLEFAATKDAARRAAGIPDCRMPTQQAARS